MLRHPKKKRSAMSRKTHTSNKSHSGSNTFPRRFVSLNQQIDAKRNRERQTSGASDKEKDAWPKWNAIATSVATFGIMLFTAAAVCVGIYQWRALRSTDDATHIAANAAKTAADTAKQALATLERPYLVV